MMKFSIYLLFPCALFSALIYRSGIITNELPQKKTLLWTVDWSPNDQLIAVGGDDIRIIDTAGAILKIIKHRKEQTGILAIRWNPSGDFFATGDYGRDKDGIKSIIQFWKTNGSLVKTRYGSRAEYRNIQWNKNGDYLASGSDALRIWNKKGELLYTGKSAYLLWGIDWNSKSDQIITTSLNGKIQLWTAQAKLIKEAVE